MIQIDFDAGEAMRELLAAPRDARNEAWQRQFDEAVKRAPFVAGEVMQGPDGFAYRVLTSAGAGEDPDRLTSVPAIAQDATEDGYGIVIDPDEQGAAAWVFHYGQLWSLRQYDSFHGDPEDEAVEEGAVEHVEEERQIMVGQPSEHMFPTYARRVVDLYLRRVVGIAEPQMLVMVDEAARPSRNLVFNLHPEDLRIRKRSRWRCSRSCGFCRRTAAWSRYRATRASTKPLPRCIPRLRRPTRSAEQRGRGQRGGSPSTTCAVCV